MVQESLTATRLLWRDLAREEPRLTQLRKQARQVAGDNPHFCANGVWYREIKPQLIRLVGWGRKGHSLLGTMAAYDLAYQTIYDELPDCRDCGCFRV